METGQEIAVQEGPVHPGQFAPLTLAVRRAIDAVQSETRALRANPTADLKAFEYGKSQALLDLTRARANVPGTILPQQVKDDLQEFKGVLDENVRLLKHHMNAVTEVVEMMSKTMIAYESDGTYQAPFPEPAR
ncbi:hypothetical protein [Roseibium aggregatum]|uniref:Flagellar protein FlgN n=1 Tax=Roseibium aggregatum TaxID=187304 RepID=A0A939EDI0_9HYPH|nr:hypothetical protein [Roseibium aggregatum]MBN9670714.1 hypothetical protein [Roseibium aggregatum]